ncbi:hypothetical protein MLD38_035553 [Melastoma candidum]|uniref:Uncharacterized protein n=1 Tax=Melastoma candidum TaxID=119954 RepID=A0ACB9LGY6_9MYRT|nr:hypothetical protein MLD38_035553 [Melastoma candidum]
MPPAINAPSILTFLKRSKLPSHLQQLHSLLIKKGLSQDHYILSHFLSHPHFPLSFSFDFFLSIPNPSTVLFNSLLTSVSPLFWVSSFSAFSHMRAMGFSPDEFTFPVLIKCCAKELRAREAKGLHGLAVRSGWGVYVFVGTSFVDFYGRVGKIASARKVFDEMPMRNVVTWTAMVVGYLAADDLGEARWTFSRMPVRNVKSWNAMIQGLVAAGELRGARELFDEMPYRDVVSFTTMIDGYAKVGDLVSARALFDRTPVRDVVAWSAMISGFARVGQANEAVRLFVEMVRCGVRVDDFAVVGLMSACAQMGCSELAKRMDSYMSENAGLINLKEPHVVAALIDMNAKSGNIERAVELFNGNPRRDMVCHCSLIQGLSMHGRGTEAVQLFNRMLQEGILPDKAAFTVILTACSRTALVDDGWHYFQLMKDKYSIVPTPDHYACMVDLLSRSGRLRAAYELLEKMPVEAHTTAWGALLGGCRLHGETELAETVSQRLFEIEPRNAGNYVLMSNIYAAADRWVDVSHLRAQMNERGIRKVPGYSRLSS